MAVALCMCSTFLAATVREDVFLSPRLFPSGISSECLLSLRTFSYADGKYRIPRAGTSPLEVELWIDSVSDMDPGRKALQRTVADYVDQISGAVLDVGPLYSSMFADSTGLFGFKKWPQVHLWDFDLDVLEFQQATRENYRPQYIDFNNLSAPYEKAFDRTTKELLARGGFKSFSAVTISQVMNYVDFKVLLRRVATHQEKGDLIFISNSFTGGDDGFHENRPQSVEEVTNYLKKLGYRLIETNVLSDKFILVGRKEP